jgi:hypothetical protein
MMANETLYYHLRTQISVRHEVELADVASRFRPYDATREIRGISTSARFNAVVETAVPGFIPRAKVN